MRVPLTVNDFLERAELVYGERVGVVDEPDQPAASWGSRHLARDRAPGPRAGRRARRARHRRRRARRDRVAQLGPAVHVAVRRERLRPGARADQLPAQRRRDRLHRRALRRVDAARRPRARRRARERRRQAPAWCSARESDEELYRFGVEPEPWAAPDEDATATINYTSGTTARPKGVQMTHRNIWVNATTFGWQAVGERPRRVPAHAADVPLQRLGHDRTRSPGWAAGTSCCARSTAPRSCGASSEHGVTLLCGAPAVVNAVLDAAAGVDGRRSPARAARGSSSPARRRRRARSSGSRPSSAGSSSRSTGSPRRRRCSR